MSTRIADFLISRKGQTVLLTLAMVLLAFTSFGLGRLSNSAVPHPTVALVLPDATLPTNEPPKLGEESLREGVTEAPAQREAYVASKKGTVYHLPWCSGAKRIAEENKVWFTTKEEAERVGYRPASNCKGI